MAVAPTYTSLHSSGKAYDHVGAHKEATYSGVVGASDTYVSGGFAFTAANVNLSKLTYVAPITFSNGQWGVFLPATGKIKCFSAGSGGTAPAEVGSTDLQSATFTVFVIGK